MKLTGSEIIIKVLKMHHIDTVAGIPGGYILPFYDALSRSGITHVLVRHEQAAGFVAQGMARTTGKPAVCLVTSGPGAINLLTAVADARCDSIPIIAISGQVNTSLIGTDAFQEGDTFGLSMPITKHSAMVKNPEELLETMLSAFEIAVSGRPGPVLIDVPKDVQTAVIEVSEDAFARAEKRIADFDRFAHGRRNLFRTQKHEFDALVAMFASTLVKAKKPVLYIGGGAQSPEAAAAVAAFRAAYKVPVVTSLMGIGVVPAEETLGMVGMHGSYCANRAMHDADLVFALGARFDDRAAGVCAEFCPNAKILHIDVDACEIGKILPPFASLVYDVETALPAVTAALCVAGSEKSGAGSSTASGTAAGNAGAEKDEASRARESWFSEMNALKSQVDNAFVGRVKEASLPNPRAFIAELPAAAAKYGIKADDILVTTDVGQHQMWTAQCYPFTRARQLLTSGSLGTMGFGLPAAVGAALANPKKRVVCFSGDGSILMNIQELATLAEQNLNVTVIVFENGVLGMVRQQQKYLFKKTYSASEFMQNPDFVAVAKGFGIRAVDANEDDDWAKTAFADGPCLVRLRIDAEEDVLPFVVAGHANIDSIR
ncbi:MAG: biosynthetic-type acetolactate synthase large subunit [Treponema sp.]|nr:biosynthetic-type acetolactate synthase large subunit [Treponema sp.]